MGHYFESGFTVGEKSWHGLEVNVKDAPSIAEGIKLAKLDWKVERTPVMDNLGRKVEGYRILMRDTDKKVLGIVKQKYRPLQNADAFAFFEPFLADGQATLETAGSLHEGQYVWVLAKLKDGQGDVTKGDTVQANLLLSNCHTGKVAVSVLFTPIRVVCWNTLSSALRDGEKTAVRIRHHGKVLSTLKAVQKTIDVSRQTFQISLEEYRQMAKKGLKTENLKQYIAKVLFPDELSLALQAEEKNPIEAIQDEHRRIFDSVEESYEQAPGASPGNVWGAYNAMTYYLDNMRGRSKERCMERSWFGDSRPIREQAHKEAMALVNSR